MPTTSLSSTDTAGRSPHNPHTHTYGGGQSIGETDSSNRTLSGDTELLLHDLTLTGAVSGDSLLLLGEVVVTTGASVTQLVPRFRRGSGTGGAMEGEARPRDVSAAAGSTEAVYYFVHTTAYQDDPEYSWTLNQQVSAADGTIQNSFMAIIAL